MNAVIIAGGKGKRLIPLTTVMPKPLLPVGDGPILDLIIRQLVNQGVDNITLAVGYMSELIMTYFGDGSKYGIKISYSIEEKPLGTAGPLSLISKPADSFLVMNSDLLTTLRFKDLFKFHEKHKAIATVGLQKRDIKIDFGVAKIKGEEIIAFNEKPSEVVLINTGIYILEPAILDHIPKNRYMDFPDLINTLMNNKEKVAGYLFEDYYLDIGRNGDYRRAINDIDDLKPKLGIQ